MREKKPLIHGVLKDTKTLPFSVNQNRFGTEVLHFKSDTN